MNCFTRAIFCCLLISLLLTNINTLSQTIVLEGRLLNEYRKPIEEATILVKGHQTHTHSGEDGYFKISSTPSDSLIIQHPEYESKIVDVRYALELNDIVLINKIVELDEVTVTGSKPNFSQIARSDVNNRPILNSQDLLRLVPGLFISQHAGGGKAEQIFLRGFDIDHGTDINLTIDGLPVNMVSHAHGQGYADMHFVIPELVKDVDYGKGPYYASKGNFTTAGFAEFQTIDKPSKSRLQLEGGMFNTGRGLLILDVSPKENENNYGYVAGEVNFTDGPFESFQNFNRINLQAKYSLKLSNKSRIFLLASSFGSKWDASGQIPDRAVQAGIISRWGSIDDTEGGNTGRRNFSLRLQTQLSSNSYIKQQLYYSKYDFNLYSNFTFFLNDSIRGDQINQRESRNIYGYQGSHHLSKEIGGIQWTQTTGIGFRYDQISNIALSHSQHRKWLGDYNLSDIFETNAFAFLDERFTIGRFVINPSLRLDGFRFENVKKLDSTYNTQSQLKAILLPKLNILFNLNTKLQLFAKTGKGFHSNDTRVVVAEGANKTLPPAYGTDLGVHFKSGKRFIGNISAWYLFLEQEFVYVGDEAIVEPSGRTVRKGLDFSGRYQALPWLTFDLDVNWAIPKAMNVPEKESYIPLAPSLTSAGGVTFGLRQGINGGLRLRHLADRPADEGNTLTASGYTIFDASLNYTKEKYQVSLVALNLFNTLWREAQFATASRLKGEREPVTEIHYTPGIPLFVKGGVSYFF